RRGGGGGGDRDRPPRRAADRRRAPRRPARRAERAAPGRGGPAPGGPLDLCRPGLPRLWPRARMAARLGPRGLRRRLGPGRTRHVPPRHAPRGDHPGARDRPRPPLRAERALGLRLRPALPVGPRRQGPCRGAGAVTATATTGADRIAAAFANSGKRAALMPYLMG